MRKITLLAILGLSFCVSCTNKYKENDTTATTEKYQQSLPVKICAEPHKKWKSLDDPLKETLTAPIGKYPCSWGKNIQTNLSGRILQTPCNCAKFEDIGLIIVDDTISPFVGEYISEMHAIWINRYKIKKMYLETSELFKKTHLKIDTVSYERYANSILQQEIWHAKNATGPESEFYSDVVSVKVDGEWFLCGSLLNAIGHHNGEKGPNTYNLQYAMYDSLFQKCGLKLDELKCSSPNETFKKPLLRILRQHPLFLTAVKDTILAHY